MSLFRGVCQCASMIISCAVSFSVFEDMVAIQPAKY